MNFTPGHGTRHSVDYGSLPSNSSRKAVNGAASGGAHRVIVGVDFGTTYSGVSWVHTSNPDQLNIITSWPGSTNLSNPKVPTKLVYHRQTKQVLSWGYQVRAYPKPFEVCVECFKLILDPSQQSPSFVSLPTVITQLQELGLTINDVVQDYLQLLYDHTITTLTRSHGQEFVEATKLEFILTVPAVWSDKSKAYTLRAAEGTGMARNYRIRLISEPEAAALYTLKTMHGGQLKAGDNFVVCDAGGGTVDLISYTCMGVNPLRLKEAVTGTGGLCGSAFLNRRFDAFIMNKLGPEEYARLKDRTKLASMKTWEEYVKRVFVDDEDDNECFAVEFPGLADDEARGIESGFMNLSRESVRDIFEPVVQEVMSLVDGQIGDVQQKTGGKLIKAILLVGGFGGSEYLFKRFQQRYKGIAIMQPIDAWTAVVRGAVLRGLETSSLVYTRKARYHYGVHFMDYWNEALHLPKHKIWDPTRSQFFADDQARWYIKKGQEVSEDKSITFEFNRVFKPGSSYVVTDTLLATPIEYPPPYITSDVIRVCKLTSDLSNVPKSLFTRKTNKNGEEYDRLDFTLEMTIESASLVFELKVGGIRYGKVYVDFDQ